jgi:hypothetical protein
LPTEYELAFQQALDEELASPSYSPREIVDTLEFFHSAFSDPVYVFNGSQYGDGDPSGSGLTTRTYTIEDGAERNAGQEVTFIACPMELVLPEQGESKRGQFKMRVSGAATQLHEYIQTASGTNEPIQAIFRRYLSDMPEYPAQVDMGATILSASLQGVTIEVSARYFEFFDYPFGKNYTRTEFPRLIGV